MKKVLLSIFILFFFVDAKAAISDKEYAACAAIKGDLSRLSCYDLLAESNNLKGLQSQRTSIKEKGKWDVSVKTNPIDDSKTVTLFLISDSGKSKWGKPILLIARCKSNETDLFISWNEYLGREASVLTRIGNAKAITQPWSMSTDSKATFHKKPIPFLTEMLNSDKLIAQITPYNESPVTAIFDTKGLPNAIKPLRETCSW